MIGLDSLGRWPGAVLGTAVGACGLAVAGVGGAVLAGTTGYFLGKTIDSTARAVGKR